MTTICPRRALVWKKKLNRCPWCDKRIKRNHWEDYCDNWLQYTERDISSSINLQWKRHCPLCENPIVVELWVKSGLAPSSIDLVGFSCWRDLVQKERELRDFERPYGFIKKIKMWLWDEFATPPSATRFEYWDIDHAHLGNLRYFLIFVTFIILLILGIFLLP